jgi:hypothetical protein
MSTAVQGLKRRPGLIPLDMEQQSLGGQNTALGYEVCSPPFMSARRFVAA